MADDPQRETVYTFTQLTEHDVIMLAAGLATPSVRAMAHLALSGEEELRLNAEKPLQKNRRQLRHDAARERA